MVTKKDYTAEAVEAARLVLIELIHLLGEYRDHIVVVGGWVPDLLLGNKNHRMSAVWMWIWLLTTGILGMMDIRPFESCF
jgi:hypothetical protein